MTTKQTTSGMAVHCPGCEKIAETEMVGTEAREETGRPVTQWKCENCGEVDDWMEFEHPMEVSRQTDSRQINVQRQITNQGKVEYSASYQRTGEYDDGTEYTGVPLSLFIEDEETTRELYECLRVLFEDRYAGSEGDR